MIFGNDIQQEIRDKFPRAGYTSSGRKRIFFDNGGGTLVLGKAAEAQARARIDCAAEEGSIFEESVNQTDLISEGRQSVADLLNAPSSANIVSGESSTSLLFRLSYALGKEMTGNENAITTDYEHYANLSPWLELKSQGKISEVRLIQLLEDGSLDLAQYHTLVDKKTKIVSVAAAANLLGNKTDLQEIGKAAREVGALFIVDAVHTVPHGPVDVQSIDCDFLIFSAYKLFSSHGAFMYGKQEHLKRLQTYKVAPAPLTPPSKWEWGNRDHTVFAAFSAVIDHLVWLSQKLGNPRSGSTRAKLVHEAMEAVEQYGREQTKAMLGGFGGHPGLLDMPHVQLYGKKDLKRLEDRYPTFAFKVKDMSDDSVVRKIWEKYSIAVRTENYYSKATEVYKQTGFVRPSLVHYNTLDEIAEFLKAMNDIQS